MTCEHCWSVSGSADHYVATLKRAEKEGWPCTKPGVEGVKLRAGQWWDEARQVDSRAEKREVFHA